MPNLDLGESLGVAGLIVGLLGFGVTLFQLSRLKSAAKASVEAVENLKVRMSHLDALQEVAMAEAAISALRADIKSHSAERWEHWSGRLDDSLIVLGELCNGGDIQSTVEIGAATKQASYLSKQSDEQSRQGQAAREKIREALREVTRILVATRVYIQRNQ